MRPYLTPALLIFYEKLYLHDRTDFYGATRFILIKIYLTLFKYLFEIYLNLFKFIETEIRSAPLFGTCPFNFL